MLLTIKRFLAVDCVWVCNTRTRPSKSTRVHLINTELNTSTATRLITLSLIFLSFHYRVIWCWNHNIALFLGRFGKFYKCQIIFMHQRFPIIFAIIFTLFYSGVFFFNTKLINFDRFYEGRKNVLGICLLITDCWFHLYYIHYRETYIQTHSLGLIIGLE